MGLMYIFPVTTDENEGDRANINQSILTLKTYGLPMVFWGYLAAIYTVIFVMWLASRDVIAKLLSYEDDATLVFLGHMVQVVLYLSPIVLLGFFFYEKVFIKKGCDLTIDHRLFFVPVWRKKFLLKSQNSLDVKHFMNSPNMAKIRNAQGIDSEEAMKHFENKGYFELFIKTQNDLEIAIDRHSRKVDLIKLKDLLSHF